MDIVRTRNGYRKAGAFRRLSMWLIEDGKEWRAVTAITALFMADVIGGILLVMAI